MTAGREIDPESADPRHVIAAALARYDAHEDIRPMHWWQAGRVVAALKAKGLLTDRRTLNRKPKP